MDSVWAASCILFINCIICSPPKNSTFFLLLVICLTLRHCFELRRSEAVRFLIAFSLDLASDLLLHLIAFKTPQHRMTGKWNMVLGNDHQFAPTLIKSSIEVDSKKSHRKKAKIDYNKTNRIAVSFSQPVINYWPWHWWQWEDEKDAEANFQHKHWKQNLLILYWLLLFCVSGHISDENDYLHSQIIRLRATIGAE